jgi:hypothetical protein
VRSRFSLSLPVISLPAPVIRRLVRRLQRHALRFGLRPHGVFRPPKLQTDYARRRVLLRQLLQLPHVILSLGLARVPRRLRHHQAPPLTS